MKLIIQPKATLLFVILLCLSQIGCDKNSFETVANEKCLNAHTNPNLTGEFTEDGTCIYKQSIRAGKVDYLFIIDNSKSMYADQLKMAQRFPTFINSSWDLDIQIAIMTTDVTKNPTRAGKFVTLSNGQKVLSNAYGMSQNEMSLIFADSITREETLNCELTVNNCPSEDVRGIFAANLAIAKNASFFRNDAHLAIIVLSDADERVFGGGWASNQYPLNTSWDTPLSLVSRLKSLGADKTMSFHSIIVSPGSAEIPELSKDTSCYSQQSLQGDGVRANYGTQYFSLSYPNDELKAAGNILEGTVGSICASDYGSQLSNISQNVNKNLKVIGLRCDPLRLDVYETGNIYNKIPYTLFGLNQIRIDRYIPIGFEVTVETECHNAH